MNTITMIDAFSNLDDDLVEKHFKAKEALKAKKEKPRKVAWVKWLSVAACFCLIITASIILIPQIQNAGNSPNIESPDKIYHCGTPVTSNRGTITLTENDTANKTFTFVFEKVDNSEYGFCIRGYSEQDRYIDENGVEKVVPTQYHIITPYEYYNEIPDNHILLDDKFIMFVNGQEVNQLPYAAGTYEIVIDYSSLYEFLDYVEPCVQVFGFGLFSLEK